MFILHNTQFWHKQPFHSIFALAFTIVYLILLIHCYFFYSRDPTSRFFDQTTAYLPRYSAHRENAGLSYVLRSGQEEQVKVNKNIGSPKLCVGMASVHRKGRHYFREAVGSLLDGLDRSERERMHLVLFIPYTDPTQHPAYRSGWLSRLADTVLTYDLPREEQEHIQQLEGESGSLFREKGLFDYVYLLKACQNTSAEYVAIIEDDVLALDGWYHRTIAALQSAEEQTSAAGKRNFFYLRLFYTEEYFGWNSEDWTTYLFWSSTVGATLYLALTTLRRALIKSPVARDCLSQRMIYAYVFIYLPLLILLFFSAGKLSLFPLQRGVHEMSNYGCCSQGLVFQQHRVPGVVSLLESRKVGFVDQLLEEYANEHQELRWAITPSILQHVGSQSSKGDGEDEPVKHGRVGAGIIYNFAFEDNDPDALRAEHLQRLKQTMGTRSHH